MHTYTLNIYCKMRTNFDPEVWLVSRQTFNPEDWLTTDKKTSSGRSATVTTATRQEHDIEVIVRRIESVFLDLTLNYQDWLVVGFALSDLGETGRSYFHRVSAFHPDYNHEKCNRQFDECLKRRRAGISIKTFFYMAQCAGINIRV